MEISQNMNGKVCLITGGTGGIGKVAAESLARMGADVVLIGRSPEKTRGVVQEIREKTGSQSVKSLIGDLSAQSEVRRVADEFRAQYGRLDVLLNNAGAFFWSRKLSQDGCEMTFALNHLAYFLLTNLLVDMLVSSAPARVINVSSAAHIAARLDFNDLQNERGYSGWKAYGQSKLANIYFTYELARRLKGTGVTANVLHPGFVATNFGRSNGGVFDVLFRLVQIGAITPEQGAETSIYLASSPEVQEVTGKYFVRSKEARSSGVSYDEEAARKLWKASLDMTGLQENEVLHNSQRSRSAQG